MSKTKSMETEKVALEQKINKEIRAFVKNVKMDNHYNVKNDLTYNEFLADRMLLVCSIREGIPYTLFTLIQDLAPFSDNDWATFLDMSTKSLQRYRQSARNFKPIHSEKIIELAEVTNLGLEVFGNMEKFRLWLQTPNFALGNRKPIELLKDSYGKEMVLGELIAINHGILA